MDSPVLAALRRLQKEDRQRQAAKERLLAAWEALAARDEGRAADVWDEVEEAYLAGEMARMATLQAKLEEAT